MFARKSDECEILIHGGVFHSIGTTLEWAMPLLGGTLSFRGNFNT